MSGPYRYWGRIDPRGRERAPLVAALPVVESEGVATLRIYGPVDSWGGEWGTSAEEVAQALDSLGSVAEIRLRLNSPGGEVYEAIAMVNLLRQHSARVVAQVDGIAASAASFLAASADELIMGRNSELMIHDAWSIGIGSAADMRALADRLDQVSDNIAAIYQRKGGGDVAGWRAAMLAETWYSADDAVASGLADRVAGEDDAAGADPAARAAFDLSIFRARTACPSGDRVEAPVEGDGGAGEQEVAAGVRAAHERRRHAMAAARHGLS